MPPSMRRQTALAKERDARDDEQKEQRALAVSMFRRGRSVREVADFCGISKSTAGRLKQSTYKGNERKLEKLLNPRDNRAGRRTIWSPEEAEALNDRVKYAAQNGFVVDAPTMKSALKRISGDGRLGYRKKVPSDAAVRTYRALNRDITYRKQENKEAAKLKAENHEHVMTFAEQLRAVEQRHPGIFTDPDRLWNMDETHVDGEFGKRRKGFTDARSHHGGFMSVQKGSGKHMTALLTASASGKLAPLFAIAAGKKVMQAWTEPLSKTHYKDSQSVPHWLAEKCWLPKDVVIRCTKKGQLKQMFCPLSSRILTTTQDVSSRWKRQ